jgi:hypothetical protein
MKMMNLNKSVVEIGASLIALKKSERERERERDVDEDGLEGRPRAKSLFVKKDSSIL